MARTWTFELKVREGCDEFWEGYDDDQETARGYATCEEVQGLIEEILEYQGLDFALVLREMKNDKENEFRTSKRVPRENGCYTQQGTGGAITGGPGFAGKVDHAGVEGVTSRTSGHTKP